MGGRQERIGGLNVVGWTGVYSGVYIIENNKEDEIIVYLLIWVEKWSDEVYIKGFPCFVLP